MIALRTCLWTFMLHCCEVLAVQYVTLTLLLQSTVSPYQASMHSHTHKCMGI